MTRCWRCRLFLQRGAGLRADAAALEDAFRLTGSSSPERL